VTSTDTAHGSIGLDSLVFLSSCLQRQGHFAAKKMLHPSTLSLYCLLELPGTGETKEQLKRTLQDWLQRWIHLQEAHPDLLVGIQEAYWDAPQCYPMSLLCEYMPLGSLESLVQACGGLPEEAMREMTRCLLKALDLLHSSWPPLVHGNLKPSQVLFGANGQPKLMLGLEQRLRGCPVWGTIVGDISPGGARLSPTSAEQNFVVDIFDLGLLLLVAALGGLDVLYEAIPYAREIGPQHHPTAGSKAPLNGLSVDTCALLQHELHRSGQGASGVEAPDIGYLPPASALLFNRRYSGPFLSFVSTCLEAHTQASPVTARTLLNHAFLTGEGLVGPMVTLQEMQGLARILNEAPADQEPGRRFGPPGPARSLVPGVAPSVAQSSQLYLVTIAQAIAPHWHQYRPQRAGRVGLTRTSAPSFDETEDPSSWLTPERRREEWEILITDTARTLGLQRSIVQSAIEAQVEWILSGNRGQARTRAFSQPENSTGEA